MVVVAAGRQTMIGESGQRKAAWLLHLCGTARARLPARLASGNRRPYAAPGLMAYWSGGRSRQPKRPAKRHSERHQLRVGSVKSVEHADSWQQDDRPGRDANVNDLGKEGLGQAPT